MMIKKLSTILLEIMLIILLLPIAILYGIVDGIYLFAQLIHIALWSIEE